MLRGLSAARATAESRWILYARPWTCRNWAGSFFYAECEKCDCSFKTSVQDQDWAGLKKLKCSQGHRLLFVNLRFSHSTLCVSPHAACSPPSSRAVCAHVCGPPATWQLRLGLGRVGAGLLLWDTEGTNQPTYPTNTLAATYSAILNMN